MIKRLFAGKKPFFFLSLYMSDVLMFLASMFASFYIINNMASDLVDFYVRISFFALLVLIVNYSALGLYDEKRKMFDETQFMNILSATVITFATIITFVLLFKINFLVFTITFGFIIAVLLTISARLILYRVLYFFRAAGYDTRKVIFFGKENEELIKRIEENKTLGYHIAAKTNSFDELKKDLHKADIVFVMQERLDEKLIALIIENSNVTWKIIPSAFNLIMDRVSFDEFKDYPIINVPAAAMNKSYLRIKRLMDILLSGIALIVLSPLLLLIIIIMKLTMPGPIFYMHERLGKDLKPFRVYKFRTMVKDADKMKSNLDNEVTALFKMKRDPRVTPFGHFMRRSCLDELPQLINIFKGDMAIVGPRPHLREELHYYKGWRITRFQVKPGLTGMWQVNGRHELNFDKAVLYDIYYIKHMSLVLDISIILKTIPSIIFSRGRY